MVGNKTNDLFTWRQLVGILSILGVLLTLGTMTGTAFSTKASVREVEALECRAKEQITDCKDYTKERINTVRAEMITNIQRLEQKQDQILTLLIELRDAR